MMNAYYECHITMNGDASFIETAVKGVGWKFSRIDGDPILGRGVKCYATRHYSMRVDKNVVIGEVKATTKALINMGCTVIRDKVEAVIYDSKLVRIREDR